MVKNVLKFRFLTLILLMFIVIYGIYSFIKLPVDAFPDPTPVQVSIYTEAPGLSAEEVESLITIPLESALNGVKDISLIRSASLPGLSYITVFFKEGTDVYFARRLIMEKLLDATAKLPQGVVPVMGPNSTGLGNILIYSITDTTGKYSNMELKSYFQRWIIRPLIMSAGGVEEIIQFGPEKAYHIVLDPFKMLSYQITLEDIIRALKENNLIVGGGFLNTQKGDLVVRGLSKVKNPSDLLNIPLKYYKKHNISITLGDIAKVVIDELPNRRGAFTLNGKEVVGNIVVKRIYENTREVVEKVKNKLREVEKILPKGIKINILYDQSYLTKKAVDTMIEALLEGIILVSFAMLLFIGNIRATLLVISSIPLTLLMSFIFMNKLGISGNLMSLGGLAIGLGLFADASVVIVENIYRHLNQNKEGFKLSIIIDAVKEVQRPVIFAVLIIAIVFTPIFSFESVEGKFFKPLALTVIFALFSSLFIALVFIPVLSFYFLEAGKKEETSFMEKVRKGYDILESFLSSYPKIILFSTVIIFLFSLYVLSKIGTEFTPELEEGALLVETYLEPNSSLNDAKRIAEIVEKTALEIPEVVRAFSTIGRAEKGEPTDTYYIETWIILKPKEEWRTFKDRDELAQILREKLKDLPASFVFTQPIKMRIDELLSGVKADVAIKVFGESAQEINLIAEKIEKILKGIRGAVDVEKEAQQGRLQLRIYPKWDNLKRYGIKAKEALDMIKYLLGGKEVGTLQEGTFLYPIVLDLPKGVKEDVEELSSIPLFEKGGKILRLSDLLRLEIKPGLFMIRRENGIRFALVMCNVEGRDLGSFVAELREKIKKEIKLPTGYFITFGGQFENQQRAMRKLYVIVPLAIFLIFLLLYFNYNSVKDALIIMLNVPFATIGGIWALYLSGLNLSVPSAIGFIAVFGIATLNGVVLVSYIRQLLEEGLSINEAVKKAARLRLRPILITASAASLGLIPMLLSSGIGSEVQKPLAAVVVGGIFTSTFLTLIILPTVYKMVYGKTVK